MVYSVSGQNKEEKFFNVLPSLFSDCFWVTCTVLWSFTWRKLSTINRILTVLVQACLTLCDPMDCSPPGSTVRGNFPGKNARVGCHALLQGIFRTQESKHRSPAVQVDSLLSEPLGKPKNTGVGNLSSSKSSWPRNWTGVSRIAGGFFTSWVTREAPSRWKNRLVSWTPKQNFQ